MWGLWSSNFSGIIRLRLNCFAGITKLKVNYRLENLLVSCMNCGNDRTRHMVCPKFKFLILCKEVTRGTLEKCVHLPLFTHTSVRYFLFVTLPIFSLFHKEPWRVTVFVPISSNPPLCSSCPWSRLRCTWLREEAAAVSVVCALVLLPGALC